MSYGQSGNASARPYGELETKLTVNRVTGTAHSIETNIKLNTIQSVSDGEIVSVRDGAAGNW